MIKEAVIVKLANGYYLKSVTLFGRFTFTDSIDEAFTFSDRYHAIRVVEEAIIEGQKRVAYDILNVKITYEIINE